MPETVDCFYTLSSPWMYLGGPRLADMIRRHGARLVLRPYDFLEVVPDNGGIPLRTRPLARQEYHALELDRWSAALGLPLNLRPRFYPPSDQRPAGRMVMAAQAQGLDAMRLSHALLRALWVEERDIALPETRAAIASENGMDGAALLTAEDTPATMAEWGANNAAATARGVFGSPTFFSGDLWIWGQDRLHFLDEHLGQRRREHAA
ncbi:2-hydroxychromene-2-carboxylate isomerase [Elioraea sp.]|uniref:2-hydroxychromene-2-carboxylate isomerase n=1 Tax=Elioraea sp. TaxID=2185103 RepID=UPI0025BFA56D|nr:2-hydroxychromene-2-carboxylate isomerase [Elioraea sp.]